MIGSMVWQPYNAKVPHDSMVVFFDKNGQTCVDIITADDLYNGISLNLALLTFEDDYHLREKDKYNFILRLMSLVEINKYATLRMGARTALPSSTHSHPHSFLQRRRARPVRECRMWKLWRHQMETFSALLALKCGEFIRRRWIPHTKASDAELWCFLWSGPE